MEIRNNGMSKADYILQKGRRSGIEVGWNFLVFQWEFEEEKEWRFFTNVVYLPLMAFTTVLLPWAT